MILLAISGIVLLPIAEELLLRGIIMATYFRDSVFWLDVMASAIVFSILHLGSSWSWNDFWFYLLSTWTLPILYKKTQSLPLVIIFHIVHNAIFPILFLGI